MEYFTSGSTDKAKRLRDLTGVGLIALGVSGAIWIAMNLIQLLTDPSSIALVQQFASITAADRSITSSNGSLTLPKSMLFGTGVFLCVMVMGISATLVKALITGGVNLLEHDIRQLLRNLKTDIASLKSQQGN